MKKTPWRRTKAGKSFTNKWVSFIGVSLVILYGVFIIKIIWF